MLGVGVPQEAAGFSSISSFSIRANFLAASFMREALFSTKFLRTSFLLVTAVAMLLRWYSNVSEKAAVRLGGAATEPAND